MFPAGSFARTSKACEPTATPEYVFGLAQPEKSPPSSRHWNVAVDSLSENVKVGLPFLDGSGGFAVIVGAGGGVVSIVQV